MLVFGVWPESVEPPQTSGLAIAAKLAVTALFIALMKPVAILTVVAFPILLGYTELAKRLFWR